jgi:type IV pilus assembly protein PilC
MAGINIKELTAQSQIVSGEKSNPGPSFISQILNYDIKLFGKSFSDKKKEKFYSQLHLLTMTGVDLRSSLELLTDQATKKDKVLLNLIAAEIMQGKALSDAMEHSGKFSTHECYSIRIGEESGLLTEILNELSSFFSKKIKQRRQLIQVFTYPAVVVSVSVGAIIFMLNFVVPMFAGVFSRFGSDLPAITKTIITVSHYTSKFFLLFLLVVGVIIFMLYSQRKKIWYRRIASKVVLRMPFFGDVIRKIYLARFCNSMQMLTAARVPIERSLSLIQKMIDFYPIEESLPAISEKIIVGEPMNTTFAQFKVYPKNMIALLKVAEEVNQLERIFATLAKEYSEEVDYKISIISSVIEPFIIIFLGLFVGLILIAMYLPIFQMGTVIH